MKGLRTTVAAALCASALGLAMGAQAQPAPGGMKAGFHHGERHGAHGGGMRALQALNLTEAQRDQIFKIHHDQAPAFREQMKKVRAAREQLQTLAKADRLDEAAVREVKRSWRLVPGTENGKPVPMWGQFAVTFKLTD